MSSNYLCLDIGNVLVNQDIESFVKAVSLQMNISKADSLHFVNRIQRKQDLALTTVRDELSTHFNIKSEYILDNLVEAWHNVTVPNRESMDFMNYLVSKYDIKVALLSNLGEEHAQFFTKVMENELFFQNSIKHFSCRVGARKPTPLYYKLFLQDHPEFKGALYLDDLLENLDTGAKEGFKTLRWDLSNENWINLKPVLEQHFINT